MAKIICGQAAAAAGLSLIVLATIIGSASAGNLTYTSCPSNNNFKVNSFGISTCDQSSVCTLQPSTTYQITIEGQDDNTETITNLPFECDITFDLPLTLKFLCGDLCTKFASDSPTQACAISAPASAKFLINYTPPLGLFKPEGTDATIKCKVWKDNKGLLSSNTPAACVTFSIKLGPFDGSVSPFNLVYCGAANTI